MRTLLMTTAVALVTATSSVADSHATDSMMMNQYEASDLIGMRLYAGDADGAQDGWEDIGEINDLMISVSGDGQIGNAIVGVGGFLGLGEKEVALGLDSIREVVAEDGETFLVVNATKEQLEAMKTYAPMDAQDMEADKADAETVMPAGNDSIFTAPAITRDGYDVYSRDELTAENLDEARVYDVNDADIGEISALVLGDDGKIAKVILDVGGFIGIGEKSVAVDFSALTILRGDDFRVYVDATQEQLEAMPEHDE